MSTKPRFDAIAVNWRKSASDVPGLEATKLYETLKKVHEDCKASFHGFWV